MNDLKHLYFDFRKNSENLENKIRQLKKLYPTALFPSLSTEDDLLSYFVQNVFPEGLLSKTQLRHPECQPHVFAAELGPGWIKLEFFVRSSKKMQCTCQGYCTYKQVNYITEFAAYMIKQLGIRT